MKKIIMLKYAELSTKKDNIGMFLKTLKQNIDNKIGSVATIHFDKGRMFIEASEENYSNVLDILKKTFGIHEIIIGYELLNNEISLVEENLLAIIKDKHFSTFKVETKRSYKNYPLTSLEISRYLGGIILKNKEGVKVDVHDPEVTFYIEIRSDHAYIYFEKIKGLGGYPVGTLGKGLLMLSGGIDSPVSGYLAMKRGVKLEAIYFESPPHTSIEAKEKVLSLANIISNYGMPIKVHIINFTKIQEEIYKNIPHEYLITIMRRMMYRISAKIAYRNNCKILVNGESIGQVASQTLSSMAAINEVIKMPVIRPVACFDKLEIISLAKKIGTYETSILPYEDCCTIFVPDHPVINPLKEKCEEYEKLIPYEDLIKEAIINETTIIKEEKKEFLDLL